MNPQPSTLNPQPSTLNPQPSTLNPQPSTLNPKPGATAEAGGKVFVGSDGKKLATPAVLPHAGGVHACFLPLPQPHIARVCLISYS